ncbi:f388b47d-2f5d-4b3d-99e3-7fcfe980d1f6 [Thermothielavioides terrestris]|uniref:F388b47d-2f5d-4b3d-99e3-7fcfe980d1f6 n=1 Tax=Thermothielavioides terrestris TaxID=2587410 RepID=A0A446B6I2_9PEZI|nr:f388b47d-2f5d-4b3d-99e3-7fcfe980d1f6 [Thermothielavioides terrestris]
MAAEAEYWSFPTNPEEFDKDDRISYSKLDNKYIAVQDDGTEYEFDPELRRWIPMIDEALIEEQQKGYIMPSADADNDSDRRPPPHGKKRKMDNTDNLEQDNNNNNNHNSRDRSSKNARRQHGNRGPPQPKQNTAVYVTGIPLDATVEEVAELFSRKCGVIAEEIDSGRPRIKMYTDAEGNFKGDALIVFFKPQSVDMAIMLLDDTDFRFPPPDQIRQRRRRRQQQQQPPKQHPLRHFHQARRKQPPPGDGRRSDQDKAKIIRKTQKLSAKLADWSDDEPSALHDPADRNSSSAAPKGGRWDRVVILRHMFTPEELRADPAALLDIKEDVREECEKLGPVTNVVLYDEEEEGIVSVRFRTREAAEACLRVMHGRAFGGRIIEAFFATGRERFRKSKGDGSSGGGGGGSGGGGEKEHGSEEEREED